MRWTAQQRIFLAVALATQVETCCSAAWAQKLQWLSRSDGLPSDQVHQVVQGPAEHLWLATPAGLARYDGSRIRTLSTRDGLTTQGIRSLTVGHDGTLWIGSDSGLDLLDEEGPRALDPAWRWGFVETMTVDREGVLWIASSAGLLRWSRELGLTAIEHPAVADTLIVDLVGDGDRLWVITQDGLFCRSSDGTLSALEDPVLAQLEPLRAIAAGSQGLWVGGAGGLGLLSQEGHVELIASSANLSGVTAILEIGEELWLGSSGRLQLYRRSGERWRFETTLLEMNVVNDIFEDSLGNVWLATDGSGVARASGLRGWLGVARLPCETSVYSIAPIDDGYLISGEFCSWVAGRDLEPRSMLDGLSRIKVWDLLLADDRELWAATETGLWSGSLTGTLSRKDFGLDVLKAPGRVLLDDGQGIWIGTVAGLARVEDGVGREVPDPQGGRFGYVYTLELEGAADGRDSIVWIGTLGRGVFRWSAERGAERPIPGLDRGNVYAIATRDDGTIALLHDDRARLWQGGRLRALEPATGDTVAGWSAEFAPGDVLWVGGLSGLVRYDLAGGPSRRVVASMGLAGDELTTSRSLYRAPDGMLIQGTSEGLAWLRPEGIDHLAVKPRPQLAEVRWNGVTATEVGGALEVPQGRWAMEAELASPWFLDATSLSIRYRLRGFDDQWSQPRALGGSGVRFTALPPGTYHLEAQVHSPLVGWGEPEVLSTLRVVPVWWNTPLARWASVLLLGLLGAGAWRWRHRALLRRSHRLEQEVRKRTRELERIASHDVLTGLPNRRRFLQTAERLMSGARRRKEPFALVVIDLDDFKGLNDRLGHQAGDRALIAVTRILSEQIRIEDSLSRYGGDELILLCPGGGDEEGRQAAERLRGALAASTVFGEGDRAQRLTASFGVAGWQEGVDLEILFQRADRAVFEAKKSKNTVVVWAPELDAAAERAVRAGDSPAP